MPDLVERIVVLLPNWVGDAVMFTPTLRALHARFDPAPMTLLGRPAPLAVLTPNPWTEDLLPVGGLLATARHLKRRRFDLGVLGPNSFRSALLARLGGVKRRVGYKRDARGWLLTDRLDPPRTAEGDLAVTPALDYYLELACYLGCTAVDRHMKLSVSDADEARAGQLLQQASADPARPLVMLNPGASYGDAKIYPAERFAIVADALVKRRGAQIVLNAGPGEEAIAAAVEQTMGSPPLLNLARAGNSIGLVKALVRRAGLLITNDTGPRHFAAAFGVPVVTLFGATDPGWTTIYYDKERIVRVDVPCGPCQKKRCPLPAGPERHQCMTKIPPEMVLIAAEELLAEVRP